MNVLLQLLRDLHCLYSSLEECEALLKASDESTCNAVTRLHFFERAHLYEQVDRVLAAFATELKRLADESITHRMPLHQMGETLSLGVLPPQVAAFLGELRRFAARRFPAPMDEGRANADHFTVSARSSNPPPLGLDELEQAIADAERRVTLFDVRLSGMSIFDPAHETVEAAARAHQYALRAMYRRRHFLLSTQFG